jgi:pyruvate dehydrogenase E2 component (dihydrolipoamide acetyltransferase)
VIRDHGSRSLDGIAAERARLVAAAREGRLDRRELAGGTITLSNLGAYPVDFFAPVISGPQIAMVATGRVAEKPVAESGWIAVRARMWANVAIDHRAADGEAGGRLLAALERQLAALPGGLR